MEKQFKNKQTFFDLDMENDDSYFATLYCTLGGANKKRAKMNRLALAYLSDEPLTEEEKTTAKKILDGTIYEEKKKEFEHCQLCSDKFISEILINISNRYNNWELCCPTHPYTPAGLMIYLKNRKELHIENLQDLSQEQFDEIIQIMKDLYDKLSNESEYNVVGINILFNQISKSQLCIHGHLETMIADIDKLGLGCEIKDEQPYDVLASLLNEQIEDRKGLYKEKEGIRIDLSIVDSIEAMKILGKYESKMKQIILHGRKIQKGEIKSQNDIDNLLLHKMSPAPVNYVYMTYYRDKFFLSIIPEIILEPIKSTRDIKDESDLYSLKINQYTRDNDEKIMKQCSPLVRPSIKISKDSESAINISNLKKSITKILEER
ncbi:MAG: hypothetical protein HXK67_02455 [Clostridiales bacterium]|nr:hypothetical protein [Clostridiales bacterium]